MATLVISPHITDKNSFITKSSVVLIVSIPHEYLVGQEPVPVGHAALHDIPEGLMLPEQLLLLPGAPGLGHHEHQLDLRRPGVMGVHRPPPEISASFIFIFLPLMNYDARVT